MAERVVDVLEAVQVEQDRRRRPGAGRGLFDRLQGLGAVGAAGRRVVVGEVAQPVLGRAPGGDVVDGGAEGRDAVLVPARRGELGEEGRAVAPRRRHLDGAADEGVVAAGGQAREAGGVGGAQLLGHDQAQRAPDRFGGGPAEQPLGRRVPVRDAAAGVGADHGVGAGPPSPTPAKTGPAPASPRPTGPRAADTDEPRPLTRGDGLSSFPGRGPLVRRGGFGVAAGRSPPAPITPRAGPLDRAARAGGR